jgi:hypothetical protein
MAECLIMADSSDIETALVALIVSAVYPNGTSQPSVVNAKTSVDRGWPTEADVRNAVAAATQLIRVHAISGMSKDTERYFRVWQTEPPPATSLIATLVGTLITFSGTPAAGQIVGVLSNGIGFTYVVQPGDTLQTVASGVAAQVPGSVARGPTVTLVPTGPLPATDAVTGSVAYLEVGRQCQVFSTSVWATTPVLRDQIFSSIMPALAANYRLTLPDNSVATRMGIQSSGPNDIPSRANVWARDLRQTWDFPIIQSANASPMAVGVFVLPQHTSYFV